MYQYYSGGGDCNSDTCKTVALIMLFIIGGGGAAFWAWVIWVNWYYDTARAQRRSARKAEKPTKDVWPAPAANDKPKSK